MSAKPRRNALVHGGGKSVLLENDVAQLEKIYKVTPAKAMRLNLSSINTSSTFYLQLVDIILKGFING